MAIFSKGILGGFSGKVGNVIGSSWKGIDYMRSKPTKVNDPKTEAQLSQRQKFRLIMSFLRKVKPILDRGFRTNTGKMSPINSASSYNLRNAITGDYPDQEIDYMSVLVSRGQLLPARGASAESTNPNQVSFSWTDNSGIGSARPDDEAMILVYNRDKDRAIYIAGNGPVRQDEGYVLDLPETFGGDTVEVYLAFVSEDGDTASDSEYLGSITVAEAP